MDGKFEISPEVLNFTRRLADSSSPGNPEDLRRLLEEAEEWFRREPRRSEDLACWLGALSAVHGMLTNPQCIQAIEAAILTVRRLVASPG